MGIDVVDTRCDTCGERWPGGVHHRCPKCYPVRTSEKMSGAQGIIWILFVAFLVIIILMALAFALVAAFTG